MVRANEFRRRNLQGRLENAKKQADNTYHGTEPYKNIHLEAFEIEVDKQIIENEHKAHIQTTINARGSKLHLQNVQLEAGKRALEAMTKDTEATIKEYEAGRMPGGASTQLQHEIGILSASKRNLSLESIRSGNADTQIQRELATALKNSASLRDHAAGIKELGADSVLASAVSAVRKAEEEDISNIQKAANFGPGKLDDIASAIEQLRDRCSPSNICLVGIRMGATLAAMATTNGRRTGATTAAEQWRILAEAGDISCSTLRA